MEHPEKLAGSEQIAVRVVGTGGMHAEGCLAYLRKGLPQCRLPTQRPAFYGNEGLGVVW